MSSDLDTSIDEMWIGRSPDIDVVVLFSFKMSHIAKIVRHNQFCGYVFLRSLSIRPMIDLFIDKWCQCICIIQKIDVLTVVCDLDEGSVETLDTMIESGIGETIASRDDSIKDAFATLKFLFELSESKFFLFDKESQAISIVWIDKSTLTIVGFHHYSLLDHRLYCLMDGESFEFRMLCELENCAWSKCKSSEIDGLFGRVESEFGEERLDVMEKRH